MSRSPATPPITDAFGTRLSPEELAAGLDEMGLPEGRLTVADEGVLLACPAPDIRRDDVARALTWLRTRLSPLVPFRTVGLDDPLAGPSEAPRVRDVRSRPPVVVAVAEVFAGDASGRRFAAAVEDALHRLGIAVGGGVADDLAADVTGGAAARAASGAPPRIPMPPLGSPTHRDVGAALAAALEHALAPRGIDPASVALTMLAPGAGDAPALQPVRPAAAAALDGAAALHVLGWLRPGADSGIRPAALFAIAREPTSIRWLSAALLEAPLPSLGAPLLLDGLVWGASRRPTVSSLPVVAGAPGDGSPIRVDSSRCTECGLCAEVCPTDYLGPAGLPAVEDPATCIRCYDCVEACPEDALRPVHAPDCGTLSTTLAHRPGWLSRLAGSPGPPFPAPFPPSYLLPRRASPAGAPRSDVSGASAGAGVADGAFTAGGPRYVLGLAVMTMQEHAAALVRDGVVVGAIEEERLTRQRHAGWHPPGRPGVTMAVDPTLCLEEALCRRPVRALLDAEGITLDDVDVFAVNGLHGRYRRAFSFVDPAEAMPTLRAGRVVFVPHHLAHAASSYRLSGQPSAWVLTVDGRGDRECGALFRGEGGRLRPVDTILALTDRSIGGVYEGVTRLLGFGTHGQGSVMALAALGEPTQDMTPFLSIGADSRPRIHESGIEEAFADRRRAFDEPIEARHRDLAASLQAALERTAVDLLRRHLAATAGDGAVGAGDEPTAPPVDALCLAGGVTLNCAMNERLRRTFRPGHIFAQPGANDAGTAIGAALEAWWATGDGGGPVAADAGDDGGGGDPGDRGDPGRAEADDGASGYAPPAMRHAYLGPAFTDDEIERVLRRTALSYRPVDDVAEEVAARLADGQVACWFQGAMEFGPRALGGRSILADPRHPGIQDRVNALKQRQPWRPFGPSVLAGHEGEWIDGAFDSRFMLFTLPVAESRRGSIPAVVHGDGSTRPQVVHRETSPRYHALIEAFHRRTGVPMLLNTSFNRRGEPIVCTPRDALDAFVGLGADLLAIGGFVVEAPRQEGKDARRSALSPVSPPAAGDGTLAALAPGPDLADAAPGRRLALRLVAGCGTACGYCGLPSHPRVRLGAAAALVALAEGRVAGCDALLLDGEAADAADLTDLPRLLARARGMGYRSIILRARGPALAAVPFRDALLRRPAPGAGAARDAGGVDALEVPLAAAEPTLHDALSGAPGSFPSTVAALRAIAASGRPLLVRIPVLRRNLHQLSAIAVLARRLGTQRVRFAWPSPVELADRVVTDALPRMGSLAAHLGRAAEVAARLQLDVSSEGLPLCALPPPLRGSIAAAPELAGRGVLVEGPVQPGAVRAPAGIDPAPCRRCAARDRCPKTWPLYLELYGSGELTPVDGP